MAHDGETVEYCVNNVDTEARSRLIEADITIHQQHCLRHCGLCHDRPFVVRDGDVVRLESHRTLIESRTEERIDE